MKRVWTAALIASVLFAGCAAYPIASGTEVVDGISFPWVEDDNPRKFTYTITFPDGTTKTTYSYDTDRNAREQRSRLIRFWIENNPVLPEPIGVEPDPDEAPKAEVGGGT